VRIPPGKVVTGRNLQGLIFFGCLTVFRESCHQTRFTHAFTVKASIDPRKVARRRGLQTNALSKWSETSPSPLASACTPRSLTPRSEKGHRFSQELIVHSQASRLFAEALRVHTLIRCHCLRFQGFVLSVQPPTQQLAPDRQRRTGCPTRIDHHRRRY
jgi:hypothetical protein